MTVARRLESVTVAAASATGDIGRVRVRETLKGGPVWAAPVGGAGGPEVGVSSDAVGGSGGSSSGGVGCNSTGGAGALDPFGATGSSGASGAGMAAGSGGTTAGGAGRVIAPPPICVGNCSLISVGTCGDVAHDPPRFQFQTHPCIPISTGWAILGAAISPHQVQFHVQVAGAAVADPADGPITAVGFGLWTALEESAAAEDDAAFAVGEDGACAELGGSAAP